MYVQQRQSPGLGALFAIPTLATTGGSILTGTLSRVGISPTMYQTPGQLESTRGDAVSQAEADVRSGQTMGSYNAGTHTETADPLNTLMVWSYHAARSGTRAAATAALGRLAADHIIEAAGPGTVIHYNGQPVQLPQTYRRVAGTAGTPGAQPQKPGIDMKTALPLLLGAAYLFMRR